MTELATVETLFIRKEFLVVRWLIGLLLSTFTTALSTFLCESSTLRCRRRESLLGLLVKICFRLLDRLRVVINLLCKVFL